VRIFSGVRMPGEDAYRVVGTLVLEKFASIPLKTRIETDDKNETSGLSS
jgi:hypothetical protein